MPQAFAIDYSAVIKKFLGLPDGKRLVLGISIGYPDAGSHVNAFDSKREATDDVVMWEG